MADILTTIIEHRTADIKKFGVTFGYKIPAERKRPVHPFMQKKGVILEVKRASPSKGDIAPELDSAETARSYARAGAAAISCLTETNYFKGSLEDLMKVCKAMDEIKENIVPAVLRKDFLLTLEEVQVSYLAGADAILLIARILEESVIVEMAKAAAKHKMTCLVEVRSYEDLKKLEAIAAAVNRKYIVCGVNSRDLATFKIDLLKPCAMLKKIRSVLGEDARVIFESGIRTPQAAKVAGSLGFTGMLLGEAAAKVPEQRKELVKAFLNAKTTKNSAFWNEFAQNLLENKSKKGKKRPLIKICGLTQIEDVIFADSLGADFAGFIFAEGFARNVSGAKFEHIIPCLKKIKAKKIAVITNPESKEANLAVKYVEKGIIDCLQLHGIPYAKVPQKLLALPHYFAITEKAGSLEAAAEELFLMGEPRFLQDSKTQNYSQSHKLWLAGGITPENVAMLVQKFEPELIDISSGVESELCKKDFSKLQALFGQLT